MIEFVYRISKPHFSAWVNMSSTIIERNLDTDDISFHYQINGYIYLDSDLTAERAEEANVDVVLVNSETQEIVSQLAYYPNDYGYGAWQGTDTYGFENKHVLTTDKLHTVINSEAAKT